MSSDWMQRILATPHDGAALVCRLTLGLVFFPHGAQLVLGWFGGRGFMGSMHLFTHDMRIPAVFAGLAIAGQFLGALGLLVGLLGRVAAFAIAMTMAVAIANVHWPNGFFMNWFGTQKGEGFEYHLLAIGLAIAVMIRGSGALSLDRWLTLNRLSAR